MDIRILRIQGFLKRIDDLQSKFLRLAFAATIIANFYFKVFNAYLMV
jgi:hypothetical protein